MEVVTSFIFLGALITSDGLCDNEIRRRIAVDKAAMGGLTTIWKVWGIKLATIRNQESENETGVSNTYCTERRSGR